MGYYSDPTAAMALGNINREFSKHEKKAKKLLKLFEEGKISIDDLENAQSQFKGLYRHVLINAIKKDCEKEQDSQEN